MSKMNNIMVLIQEFQYERGSFEKTAVIGACLKKGEISGFGK